ncbi:uncharacterized protein LOC120133535 [Hibiscus syriacus]|uniref:uncharacterized protein LOC120133535 n=1 Tax=Hibiscus syriacus TaxID=106335 RepID=UPI001924D956|nr:uncharacterized protein LOC120133535 [Hibiscus syriacus]
MLRCFELSSELKIKFRESCLVGVGIQSDMAEVLARVCECRVGNLPFSYLDIPLRVDPRKMRMWELIVERFQTMLSGWKSRTLSFAGRVVLIGSISLNFFAYRGLGALVAHFNSSCWLARDDKVFNGKSSNIDDTLFNIKSRAIIWIKALQVECLVNFDGWWDNFVLYPFNAQIKT